MKRIKALILAMAMVLLLLPVQKAAASGPTDEILNYIISVEVNEDATLTMKYHIVWKALYDGGGSDPLTWVKIGIPNDHTVSFFADSDNISKIGPYSESGASFARVDFKDKYYKNDICEFDFTIVQDYMYEMNVLTEGESVFYFTPGWFEDIAVDRLTVSWNADKAIGWSHGANNEDGYLMWEASLSAGERMDEISVTYPNSAFAFDESKMAEKGGYYGGNYESYEDEDDVGSIIGGLFFVFFIYVIIKAIRKSTSYSSGSGFKTETKTQKKVTRTLIKYYPTCPGCGAARPENADKCEYCGRSFIESEEVVEEKEIKDPDKYADEGTFRYGDSPNTFVRVHVTHVPIVVRTPVRSSCAHSSCAHSSCACAHSCACACACACAGGGRAGCSTKDFYNTGLKLRQIQRRKKNT